MAVSVLVLALLAAASATRVPIANQLNSGLQFLALGDWGGQGTAPYTEPGEIAAAAGMAQVAQAIGSSFVLALGDNFYDTGIQGDVHSPRFQQTFEDVYTAASLQTPWFVLAGNHDHYGNVSAEIAYTAYSPRWTFPDYYYNKIFSFNTTSGAKTFEVIFIDTVLLAGNTDGLMVGEQPPGPADLFVAETQWQWIEATLAASTADYLWVAGHYPIWSVCEHGPTAILVSQLKPLMEKYNATGYLSGHDHCQEFLDDGSGLVYVLIGNGDNCCYADTNESKVPANSVKYLLAQKNQGNVIGGFASFDVGADFLNVHYYDQDGNSLWTSPNVNARSASLSRK